MKARLIGIALLISFIVVAGSCKNSGKTAGTEAIDSIDLSYISPLVHNSDSSGVGLPIFYNMYLSVELTSLFESSGAVYRPELLNSPDKSGNYVTSSKKALNLGVYAVDLSYTKVSEQLETAGRYFNAMQRMAEEMGIPSDYFRNTAERFDKNIDSKDSLIKIANEVYMASDNYLRENERYAASAQIILGGWVEAIHIATNVAASTKDMEIIERLADQKTSLSNLINMLSEYNSDVDVNRHLEKLKQLQPVFNSFIVNITSDFSPSSAEGKKITQEYLFRINEISKQIKAIRTDIIS
jgi:hypothetical protein